MSLSLAIFTLPLQHYRALTCCNVRAFLSVVNSGRVLMSATRAHTMQSGITVTVEWSDHGSKLEFKSISCLLFTIRKLCAFYNKKIVGSWIEECLFRPLEALETGIYVSPFHFLNLIWYVGHWNFRRSFDVHELIDRSIWLDFPINEAENSGRLGKVSLNKNCKPLDLKGHLLHHTASLEWFDLCSAGAKKTAWKMPKPWAQGLTLLT